MKKIHLVCNAHLDPVWLWQRAEGMAEAMATFRIAADFCEKYDGFVFNHNESVLYEWVLENEPELFERIQKLVKKGKWRIMAGWYLQPDVLMPCGESIIRQISVGNEFFEKHFGEIPKTSIGFDAFGHSKGLVQILKKCGYDNYAYLRPREREYGPFVWEGFDGSRINALKLYEWYNTPKGEAVDRLKNFVSDFPNNELSCVTWGIGNHGGGPSEKDFNDINDFSKECKDFEFIHSDFDAYFDDLDKENLSIEKNSLTHCNVGCYTSMVRIKQGHRRLENKISMCEKMLCQSGVEYDKEKLKEAEKALLFVEFHDILPGSAIKKVEDDALNLIGYGNEILDRMISKAFFKMCRGQEKAKEGEIPVLVYNPHPYPIEGDFAVEFQLAEQNHPDNGIYTIKVRNEKGEYVPCQLEQEDSAHGMDWRKRVIFRTKLSPMGISRFDCELELDKNYVKIKPFEENETHIILKNNTSEVHINKHSGYLDKYICDGKNMINAMQIRAYNDDADPWGMEIDGFEENIGSFESDGEVRVIENGDVRTKVQAKFKYNNSYAFITYVFSDKLDLDVKILANDENKIFKLCIDTALDKNAKALGQTMFGTEELIKGGKEAVFQKWCGLKDGNNSVDIINAGTYGGSFEGSEMRISLLRTPVYSAHPVDGVELAPNDRIYNHIDMGERDFSFRLCVNEEFIDCEADVFNQNPFVLSFFPCGMGEKKDYSFDIDNKKIILSAMKKVENGTLLRLFNSSAEGQKCVMFGKELEFKPFEIRTFVKSGCELKETDLLNKN